MKPEDYPPQEPISDFAREYSRQLLEKAAEIGGAEENYGPDPYQSVLYFPAPEPDGNVFIMIHGGGWTKRLQGMDGIHGAGVQRGLYRFRQHRLPAGPDSRVPRRTGRLHERAEMGLREHRKAFRRPVPPVHIRPLRRRTPDQPHGRAQGLAERLRAARRRRARLPAGLRSIRLPGRLRPVHCAPRFLGPRRQRGSGQPHLQISRARRPHSSCPGAAGISPT